MLLGRPVKADKEAVEMLTYQCKVNLEAREAPARRQALRVAHHRPRLRIPQLIWEPTG